jgi:methionyl-tRNA formyltransferase
MRIIFMGTPAFSVPVLQGLVAAGHEVVAVYCQPPRPAGRGGKDRRSEVQKAAETLGLPVLHPRNFKNPDDIEKFHAFGADVAVVAAYGLILPQAVLDAPGLGCLNIHASLLPRWRGAAPIHRAIMAGDAKTGVCIMQMQAGLDTGPVLMRWQTGILPGDTTASLHDRLSLLGRDMVLEVLRDLAAQKAMPQDEAGVIYAKKIDKSEAQIDWHRPAAEIDRQIRGLSPFPGAWSTINGQRVKLLDSRETQGTGQPGEVLQSDDDGLTVACKTGAVRLLRLQRASKSALPPKDFLRGFSVAPGSTFGQNTE